MKFLLEQRKYLAKLIREDFIASYENFVDQPMKVIFSLVIGFIGTYFLQNPTVWLIYFAYVLCYLLLFVVSIYLKSKGTPMQTSKTVDTEKMLASMSEREKIKKSTEFMANPPIWFYPFVLSYSGIIFGMFFWIVLNIFVFLNNILRFFGISLHWIILAAASFLLLIWIMRADPENTKYSIIDGKTT